MRSRAATMSAMSPRNRRNFLKRAGAAVGVGGVLATGGLLAVDETPRQSATQLLAAAEDADELPPLRGPFADEDWTGYRSGPGHDGAIEAAPDVDPERIDCTCFYEGSFDGEAAIVDDTMYFTDGGGRIVALDAHDATVRWTSDDIGASGTPSAAYGTLVTGGDGKLLAYDLETRSVDWEREYDDGPTVPTVAYEAVFVVADDDLYAVEVADGSLRWVKEDETFDGHPAASAGRVYATPDGDMSSYYDVAAYDPVVGEELWRTGPDSFTSGVNATDERVTVGYGIDEMVYLDPETGESSFGPIGWGDDALDDEIWVMKDNYGVDARFWDDRDGWKYPPDTGIIEGHSDPTVTGDTVFVYFGENTTDAAPHEHELVALEKSTGEVKWSCEGEAVDGPAGFDIVATSDAVYVFGDEAIHTIQEADV